MVFRVETSREAIGEEEESGFLKVVFSVLSERPAERSSKR